MIFFRFEEASKSYAAGKEMLKAASCLMKQAKAIEVSQLTESLNVKPLNFHAAEWHPKNKNNTNKNANNNTQPQNITHSASAEKILALLTNAKGLIGENSDHTSFQVGILIFLILHYSFTFFF